MDRDPDAGRPPLPSLTPPSEDVEVAASVATRTAFAFCSSAKACRRCFFSGSGRLFSEPSLLVLQLNKRVSAMFG